MSFSLTIFPKDLARCSRYLSWSPNLTWPLHVPDDTTGSIVHKLNSDLGNTTTRTTVYSDVSTAAFIEWVSRAVQTYVRPRTRVTLTSLIGVFDASMIDY